MAMTEREKAIVGVGAFAVAAFAAFVAFVRPALQDVETLRRVLPERRQTLAELEEKASELAALRESLVDIRQQTQRIDRDFGLMAYLESIQKEAGIEDHVGLVRPSTVPLNDQYDERVVDMRLEGVSLAEIVRFLEKIEAAEAPLQASEVTLRRQPGRQDTLNATVQIRMLALAEGG